MIIPFGNKTPKLASTAFCAPDAWIIGDVSIDSESSILFGAVVRGDLMPIKIGAQSNIQDQVVVHTSNNRCPTEIGSRVSIGHRAILHGCQINDQCIIGMGAIIMDEVVVGSNCLVAAGALITEKTIIPDNSLVIGSPGRVTRSLSKDEVDNILETAKRYVRVSSEYKNVLEGIENVF